MRRSLSPCLVLVLAACGSDGGSSIPAPCNPLGHEDAGCTLPWPSSAFLGEDDATATGYRVDLPLEAMPVNINEDPVDPSVWNTYDGFSPSGAIIAAFPGGVSPEGLPGIDEPGASLEDDAAIALVDVETGERVLAFAEVDMNAEEALRTLLIRPLARLRPGARYAVGVSDWVKRADGEPLERSAGFAALAAGEDFDHPRWDRVSADAAGMFTALEAAGLPRERLVLAWDFRTSSDEFLTRDLLSMRSQALPAIGELGAELGFELTEVDAGNPARVHQAFVGTFDTPSFLDEGESNTTRLVRDDDGAPLMVGMDEARLAVIIPACVAEADLPLEVVLFGHGLFGTSEGYIEEDFLQDIANQQCVVIVATDFIGLSERQLTLSAFAANDYNRSHSVSEMLGQGVINFIVLEHLLRGALSAAPQLTYEGAPVIDPSRMYYLGGSLGGILGGVFMSYDPYIERGVLGVPGGAWSLLIERSTAWTPLQIAAKAAYKDPYAYEFLVGLLAWSFERWDPITTARRVLADPLPDTPAKQLLLYYALNDSFVSNLSSEALAREMGIPVTMPTVRMPFGIPAADGPAGSALTVYDEHPEPVPVTNIPPLEDNGTHGGVNEQPAVIRAALRFLREGEIVNPCGPEGSPEACDCATGACD